MQVEVELPLRDAPLFVFTLNRSRANWSIDQAKRLVFVQNDAALRNAGVEFGECALWCGDDKLAVEFRRFR